MTYLVLACLAFLACLIVVEMLLGAVFCAHELMRRSAPTADRIAAALYLAMVVAVVIVALNMDHVQPAVRLLDGAADRSKAPERTAGGGL